jgi:hypothetical protein
MIACLSANFGSAIAFLGVGMLFCDWLTKQFLVIGAKLSRDGTWRTGITN